MRERTRGPTFYIQAGNRFRVKYNYINNYDFCSRQLGSKESSKMKSYHTTAIGAVARCQSEWASMTPNQGGKSNSSRAEAAIVKTVKMPILLTKRGLYDFGLDGNRWMRDIEEGSEYTIHMKL